MGRLTSFTFRGQSIVRDLFIETGTFTGDTLALAVAAGFKRLISIEYVEQYYRRALGTFRDHANVKLFHGSSPEVLRRVLDRRESATFWLDAHFQGGSQDEKDDQIGECPLIEELRVIFERPWKTPPIILIDDAGMFTRRVPTNFIQAQWPTIADIANSIPYNYSISTKDTALPEGVDGDMMDDVIYCIRNHP